MNRTAKQAVLLLIPAVIILTWTGCVEKQTTYLRDGNEYGTTSGSFSGRWWNYYERGRSFADGRFYAEAITDFAQAIKGRGDDQWRARTYGMHFVDYFPHRELGIVYFQRQEYDRAISELEQSIATAPSAKAHYFLNKSRAARIQRMGQDRAAPELQLEEGGTSEVITSSLTKRVSGVASDDTYVAAVKVGPQEVYMELAERQRPFSTDVALNEGENRIRVVTTDLAGKSSEKTLNVYCDRRGPQIEITGLALANSQVKLQGSVSDDRGLRSLKINDKDQPVPGHPFAYDFSLMVPAEQIRIEACDLAGNVTRAAVRGDKPDLRRTGPQSRGLQTAYLADPAHTVVSDAALLLASAPPPPVDTEPPYIRLEGPGPEEETYEDMVLLEGMVSDNSQVVSITVNGEPVLNRKGSRVYFSVLKQLSEGQNELQLIATDEHGNTIAQKVQVTRKIHKIRQIGSRLSVAVLPFEQQGEPSRLGNMVHDQIIDSFLEQARFNIVERKKMDAVLRELRLSTTELVAPEQAAKLGKIVAAQGMLAGSVIETPDAVEIIGRLIDSETATIIASNDIFGEDKGLAALDSLLDNLAFKFKRDFPLVEGILLEVRGKEVLIDAGSEKRIKPNTWLLCYREGQPIKHPVTGRLISPEPRILSRLKVEEVFEDFSKATVVDQDAALLVSDKVIAQ